MNFPAKILNQATPFARMQAALDDAHTEMATTSGRSSQVGEHLAHAGALSQLGPILTRRRKSQGTSVVFLIDHFFENHRLVKKLPRERGDLTIFVDSTHEPSTRSVDAITKEIRRVFRNGNPSALVGIGGGTAMDTTKAVSNLLTNSGPAASYQGWDLVENPGVYKIGIPTLSGTGAEASRTCVLTNYDTGVKLGMNSDYTLFDFVLMDPELTESVSREQYFFTGMDTYIHCVESLSGSLRHPAADLLSHEALTLVREVFFCDTMQSVENREKLMAAAFLGGCAIANSMVGVVHPFSAGLSIVKGTHHCEANCIALQGLDEFYPEAAREFEAMRCKQNITIRQGLCQNATAAEHEQLRASTVVHEKPLRNALGDKFEKILNPDRVKEIFNRM